MIRYECKNGDLAKRRKKKGVLKRVNYVHPQNILRTLYSIELSVECSSR